MRAIQITVDGGISEITIDRTSTLSALRGLQRAVGGRIEPVMIADDAAILVDEEGLLKGLPVNTVASSLTGRGLVGTAVIVGVAEDAAGEHILLDCPKRFMKLLR